MENIDLKIVKNSLNFDLNSANNCEYIEFSPNHNYPQIDELPKTYLGKDLVKQSHTQSFGNGAGKKTEVSKTVMLISAGLLLAVGAYSLLKGKSKIKLPDISDASSNLPKVTDSGADSVIQKNAPTPKIDADDVSSVINKNAGDSTRVSDVNDLSSRAGDMGTDVTPQSEKIVSSNAEPDTKVQTEVLDSAKPKIDDVQDVAGQVEKIQLSEEDIKIKSNMQNLLGAEISDDIYLKIKNTQSDYSKGFSFSDLHNYTDEYGFNRERYSLFEHIKNTLYSIETKSPLENESICMLQLKLLDKVGIYDSNLKKWNYFNYLQGLYSKHPEVNFKNKEQILEAYNQMANTWLAPLKGIEISASEKDVIMEQLLGFKQGIGSYITPDEVSNADFINAILHNNRFPDRKERFNQLALSVAKKINPSYEEATRVAIDNGWSGINLLYRKGDNLIKPEATKVYDQKTQDFIINSYLNCGDDTLYGAYYLNSLLRDKPFDKIDVDAQDVIKGLDKLVKESDKLDKDYVVYRTLGFPVDSEQYLPWKTIGNVVTDKAFVSTTPTNGTYLNMFGGRQGTNYVLRIKLPKGTQGINMYNMDYLSNGKNSEYLLPRSSSFKILGVNEDTKIIDVEYLLPEQLP